VPSLTDEIDEPIYAGAFLRNRALLARTDADSQSIARWVAEQEDKEADKRNATSNWADEMRRLIEVIRPK
jgi:hypothetical protein